jgi:hypothetical protein
MSEDTKFQIDSDESIDLADGDLGSKRFKIVGVRMKLVAQLIVEDLMPDDKDDPRYFCDDILVTLNTHDVELPPHHQELIGDLPSLPSYGELVDIGIHDLALPPVGSMEERVNEIADSFDEMVSINVPVSIEIQREAVMTVNVPRAALLRAAYKDMTRTGEEANASAIAQLVYAHNDLDNEAKDYPMLSSPDVMCRVEHPRDINILEDDDLAREMKEIAKTKQ